MSNDALSRSIAIGFPVILTAAKVAFKGSRNIRSRGSDTPSEKGANKQQQQLNPQPGTFAAAWYTVYVAMGLASWLIWKQGGLQAQALCLTLYVAQLGITITAWPSVFVGGHTRKYAIADAAALFGTSLATTASFYRVHQAAGLRNAAVPLLGVLCNSSHQLQLDRWQADPKRTP